MAKKVQNVGMIAAIVFASVAISGSLVFFGLQLSDGGTSALNMEDAIQEGIVSYIANQEVEQREAAEKAQLERELAVGNVAPPSDSDHVFGPRDAEISLIEYSDFDCPFCQRAHPTFKQLVEEYNGKVNWVYRDFPLPGHDPSATAKSVAANCVAKVGGNDKFWKFTDLLFEEQSSIKGTSESLSAAAAKVGVSGSEFTSCLSDKSIKVVIAASLAGGSIAGVSGTPGTIVVNNKTDEKRMVEGAQPFGYFKSRIDEMLR